MSTPASRTIDTYVTQGLARVFDQIDRYVFDGNCTYKEALVALENGWGDVIAEAYREWIKDQ